MFNAAFAKGTESAGARPVIWTDPAGFIKAQERLQASLKQLTVAADSGDLAKLRAALGNTGTSCKACHDAFHE